jgi:hypothetical protein
MADLPGRPEFAAQVDSDFVVVAGEDRRLPMRLVGIEDGYSTPDNEQFALHFHVTAEMPPHQGTYRVEHEALGPMDVFLVPIAQEGDTLVLEAVFNRFVDVEKE